jgi:urease accessory protein
MNTPSGWQAELRLGFTREPDRTVLAHRYHRGPLTVQRPFQTGEGVCEVCLLHPPAGVVGGDELLIGVTAAENSRVLVTTPAATKFYRSEGATASQAVDLHVARGACLEWLPQESIFYQGTRVRCRVRVDLHEEARFIGWEACVLGRPAAGEGFAEGQVWLDWQMDTGTRPLLRERQSLDRESLDAIWGLGGQPMTACLWAYPATSRILERLQALTADDPDTGVTVLDKLLVVRSRDRCMMRLQKRLRTLWAELRPDIIGCKPQPPRIWNT